MKVLCLVLALLFAVVSAQVGPTPLFAWAGNTFNSSTNYTLPSVDFGGDSSCYPYPNSPSYYVVVNFTVPTTGVYEVIGLSNEQDWNVQVYLYSGGFTYTNSCAYYVRRLDNENAPLYYETDVQVDDFVYFTAGVQYFLVAAGSDWEYWGTFAINIFAPLVSADNFGSGNLWNYTTYDYEQTGADGCSLEETDGSARAPYVRWAWNQPTTGVYDIIVAWARNETDVPDFVTSLLYSGNVSDADIAGENPCSPTAPSTIIIGQEGETDYTGTTLFGVSLTAGQVYTLVFSGDEETDFGRYGIFVGPTRMVSFNAGLVLFTPPGDGDDVYGFYDTCPATEEDTDSYPWAAYSWENTVGTTTLISLSNFEDVSGWTEISWPYSYVYNGVNDGSSLTAPTACPLVGASFVGGWENNVPGLVNPINHTYTLVIEDWEKQSTDPTYSIILYILTGTPVGYYNATILATTTGSTSSSTTSSSTSTSTTSTATTSTPTTANPTTSSSTTSTPAPTTSSSTTSTPAPTATPTPEPIISTSTSGAAAVSVSVVVVVLSVFALLF